MIQKECGKRIQQFRQEMNLSQDEADISSLQLLKYKDKKRLPLTDMRYTSG